MDLLVRQAVERAGERVQSGGVRQVRVGVATTLDKKKSYRQPGGNDLPTRAVNRRPRSFGIAAKYKCRSMLMRKIEQTCFTIIFLIRNLQLYMFYRRTEKAPCKFARAASATDPPHIPSNFPSHSKTSAPENTRPNRDPTLSPSTSNPSRTNFTRRGCSSRTPRATPACGSWAARAAAPAPCPSTAGTARRPRGSRRTGPCSTGTA